MELNQQIVSLQDEVKLLKGEIKTILKELRTAVLNRDNPFTTEASPPVFRPIGRSDGADGLAVAEEPFPQELTPRETASEAPSPAAPAPSAPPAAPAPSAPPASPAALRLVEQTAVEEPPAPTRAPSWNPLTVASLAAWAEDALSELGPRRFQIVLDLSCLAGLLSTEVKEVLAGMSQFAPEQTSDERPIHINNCLVVLHQLEAILRGEEVSTLPRRRRIRRARAR